MRIAEINMFSFGSTGKIMLQIADCVRSHGDEAHTYATLQVQRRLQKKPVPLPGHFYFGSQLENTIHYLRAYHSGKNGMYSVFSTKRLLRELEAFSPDIVHLHNLHAAYLHYPTLFGWLKQKKMKVVWTFHDCWPFTGKCACFEFCGCERWKTGCHDCPQLPQYPAAKKDCSAEMWEKKRKWFTELDDLHIVTPSVWLSKLVQQSFLKDWPICVIKNGIDLNVFRPTPGDFRKKHRCEDKFVILGVAFPWGTRKGLDAFIELANRLDENYQIVLAGTDERIDQRLPKSIISIHATKNQEELASIYSAADLFVNPTLEDNYPTVNLEAIACGTPVVTYRTGGSPEAITPETGMLIEQNDLQGLTDAIRFIRANRPFSAENCAAHAKAFDKTQRFEEYYQLYKEILKG